MFNTVAVLIHNGKVIYSIDIVSVCGFGIIFSRFFEILIHALSFSIAISQRIQRLRVSLLGGKFIPFDGGAVIFLYTLSEIITIAKLVL